MGHPRTGTERRRKAPAENDGPFEGGGAGQRAAGLSTAGLDRLCRHVAHDLRNGLAVLRTNVDYLEGLAPRDEAERAALGDLREVADRMEHGIDHLVYLVRYLSGTLTPSLQPISMDTWLRALVRRLEEAPGPAAGRIRLEAPEPARIWADPALLERALRDLVLTRLAHTAAPGPVELRFHRPPGWAELTVIDSGPPLSPAARASFLDPRAPLGEGRLPAREVEQGLVGPFCGAVVAAHGGQTRLEVVDGRNRFTLRLPQPG
ncbi:MAG: sensor histidine kinase [Deltaproteobacteria bacterium]|nr:MAG: sensor histidine kinase [Deltaproteobacteria bacterium]